MKFGYICGIAASTLGFGTYLTYLITGEAYVRTLILMFFLMMFISFILNATFDVFSFINPRKNRKHIYRRSMLDNTNATKCLVNLKELLDKGIISEEEYLQKRSRYIEVL